MDIASRVAPNDPSSRGVKRQTDQLRDDLAVGTLRTVQGFASETGWPLKVRRAR